MRLPYINSIRTVAETIGTFGGLNQSEVIGENEFADMLNMSSDIFPAACPRRPRGDVMKTMTSPNGLHFNNALFYVDGTKAFYDGKEVGELEDSEKQMASMGAYIVILPDKKVYNTHTGEWKNMEAFWEQTASVGFAPTVEGSTFIKVSCPGIGANFSQGDGVEISGCTNESFNKSAVIQSREDDSIVIIGSLTEGFTQDAGLVLKRKVPDMDFITESENRLWGCSSKNHEVYASKLGDPLNWNAFEGISTDSYAATIGSDGDFTGAITHQGYVLFMKEDMIHKVYGNKPSNIQINAYPARGVKKGCEASAQIVNETLYYASYEGICAYDGATPHLVSDGIKKAYTEARGGSYRGKYYVSLKIEDEWELYAYDTKNRLWHKEDATELALSCTADGVMYYVDEQKNLRELVGVSGRVEWRLESGEQIEGSLNKKSLHKLQLRLELECGTMAEIFIKHENDPLWQHIGTITPPRRQTYAIQLRPRRNEHYRWKVEGIGDMKLLGLGKIYRIGTDR